MHHIQTSFVIKLPDIGVFNVFFKKIGKVKGM